MRAIGGLEYSVMAARRRQLLVVRERQLFDDSEMTAQGRRLFYFYF